MKLNESIGRFPVRKVIRFALNLDHCAAVHLDELIAEDEQRAESLNMAKAAIEAEHLTMVRRVFKALPNPLPEAEAIRRAFKADPEYKVLSGRNAAKVMNLIVDRCRYNGWKIPDPIRDLEHWSSLFVKWHWHCTDRLQLSGEKSLPRQWEGRAKADVEKSCRLLLPPKKRKPSRNNWFDHAPFRMMFGNQTCGMSWLKEDFAAARTFLLLDGERILIGVVPRNSRFCPYTLPDAQPGELAYRLYEEGEGQRPTLREVPKLRLDVPAERGLLILFALDGRGLRSKSNLNALYLRALFSAENLAEPVFHLERDTSFQVRKGTEIPREGKGDHFRQRFTEDRLFATLSLTINAHLVATGAKPQPFGNLSSYIENNPTAKFIHVAESPRGGFVITLPQTVGRPSTQTFSASQTSLLVGTLARLAVTEDAAVLFARRFPKRIRLAVADKFAYIVLKDRPAGEPGGVRCGYQLTDRLFVGDLADTNSELQAKAEELRRKQAMQEEHERARREKAVRKAVNKARAEEAQRLAALRRPAVLPDFAAPPFETGACRFKVEFRTSDNMPHAAECRADTRDEMFAKMRTVGIRPSRVTPLSEASAAPAVSTPGNDFTARLRRLDVLREQGLLTDDEYTAQRTRILSEL